MSRPRSVVSVQLPVPDESLRMVAVHAHPDDESSKGAGSMARYAREGVEVTVLTCTGGERGDVLNPRLRHDTTISADLPAEMVVSWRDRKSTRLNSSHVAISYAVFCLKKKTELSINKQ